MDPKVSICIPCYNQTTYLRKTIESVLIQDYSNFEVIVTDDSDTNAVSELVQHMLANVPFQVVYHKNPTPLGSPANWNKAMELASGEFIKVLHHDDWFAFPHSLSAFVAELSRNPSANFMFCNTRVFDVSLGKERDHVPGQHLIEQLAHNPEVLFNNNFVGSPSATLFRAQPRCYFDTKLKYLVDVEYYIRVLRNNPHFVYLNTALVVNTSNLPGQVTASSINKQVQLGEYSYLYNKLFNGRFPPRHLRVFFADLFAWYGLGKLAEIEQMGYELPRPVWAFRLLNLWSKLRKA